MCVCVCVYIYIYIYERERERERERDFKKACVSYCLLFFISDVNLSELIKKRERIKSTKLTQQTILTTNP